VTSASVRIDPGTSVGPYVVERRLAQGGMSVLYVARAADGGRVVLKMVPLDVATSVVRARLLREARALAAVDHVGVVRVHGVGEHAGMAWIAMDYVQGSDLKHVIAERGPMRVEVAVRYAIEIAEALAAAHDAGVVHRDLKPSNLLLTTDGRMVVVDFGIAKRRPEGREGDATVTDSLDLGTPAYLSPEQIEHGLADERSDVWALGCVFYEMLVGSPPFGRGGPTTTAAILRDEPTFPPTMADAVVHVVSACLRKSSFARVASPRELLPMLRDALEVPRGQPAAGVERTASSGSRASARPPARQSAPPPPSVRTRGSEPLRVSSSSRVPSVPPVRTSQSSQSVSSVRVPARGHVKGTAVRAGLAWYADRYGDAAMARVVELASGDLRSLLRVGDPAFGLIASGWYETHLIGELLDVLERVAAPEDPVEFGSRLAAAVARDNVGGVYRVLFRLISSPPLLEANAQRVWRTYVDEGTLAMRITAPGAFEGCVRGWSHHHPTVCRLLRPMLEHMLRAIGYSALVVERSQCVLDGDGQCVFVGNWIA
jgi:serine/threonine protein kinase